MRGGGSIVARRKGDLEMRRQEITKEQTTAIQSAGKEWTLKLGLQAQAELIGKFVGLNSQTGDYVLGDTPSDVLASYKQKFEQPRPPIYLYVVGSEIRA
jgi:hypothetical protein